MGARSIRMPDVGEGVAEAEIVVGDAAGGPRTAHEAQVDARFARP